MTPGARRSSERGAIAAAAAALGAAGALGGALWLSVGAAPPGMPPRQEASPCAPGAAPGGAASPDLYCMSLFPTPRVPDATGTVELRRPPGPFSVGVTPDGRLAYDAVISTDLPPPSTLGPYDRYVAWASTQVLWPIERLGEVPARGRAEVGQVGFNKFLILVTAESGADPAAAEGAGAEPAGPYVLRAQSPSSRMQPADFLEFALGATRTPPGEMVMDDAWGGVPMPEGVMMLPSLMELRPDVQPWLPGDGWEGEIVDARPRELIELADGDSLSLDAVYVRRRIGSRELLGYGFNGQIPGPLLWVPEDATVTIDFTNRIDWPTAIHWHGLRLDNRFDGVPGLTQDVVAPGESFRYTVHFPDPGLYWYHPHHREDVQQDLGLAGNLMVRSEDPDYFSPVHREEVVMLDDLLLGEHGIVPFGLERATHALMGRFGNTMLVNGRPDYALDVERGSVVRFYFTNASNTRTFNLSFGGAPMKLVGADVGNFEREEWVESVIIAPAERYIVHVAFPESGSYALLNRVQGIDHIGGSFFPEEDTLGVVRVGAADATPDLGATFEVLRENERARDEIAPYRPLFDRPVDLTLELDMSTRGLPLVVERLMQVDSAYFHPVEWSGTMPMMNLISTPENVSWTLREPSTGLENEAIRWTFRVGDVVKLRLRSRRETLHQMQHPIHIHGQRFLVLATNGVAHDNLAWKDMVVVPVGGSVDLLLELSNPGRWMLHCHIAEHLEAGMQMVFTVEP
ncbi:MAG: multicopper oxidase family protein [Gemmatimonadales bacterium]|nr:multicopper oxidase family protein [Candidatus Palauibacter irciniicola]MYC19129.1 multicopper oxidase family protein [Gemmatimonadales bacterium]